MIFQLCHGKRFLKSWVIVIPKEDRRQRKHFAQTRIVLTILLGNVWNLDLLSWPCSKSKSLLWSTFDPNIRLLGPIVFMYALLTCVPTFRIKVKVKGHNKGHYPAKLLKHFRFAQNVFTIFQALVWWAHLFLVRHWFFILFLIYFYCTILSLKVGVLPSFGMLMTQDFRNRLAWCSLLKHETHKIAKREYFSQCYYEYMCFLAISV